MQFSISRLDVESHYLIRVEREFLKYNRVRTESISFSLSRDLYFVVVYRGEYKEEDFYACIITIFHVLSFLLNSSMSHEWALLMTKLYFNNDIPMHEKRKTNSYNSKSTPFCFTWYFSNLYSYAFMLPCLHYRVANNDMSML